MCVFTHGACTPIVPTKSSTTQVLSPSLTAESSPFKDLNVGVSAYVLLPSDKVSSTQFSSKIQQCLHKQLANCTVPFLKLSALVDVVEALVSFPFSILIYSDVDTSKTIQCCQSYGKETFGETMEHEPLWMRLTSAILLRKTLGLSPFNIMPIGAHVAEHKAVQKQLQSACKETLKYCVAQCQSVL